MKEKFIEKIRPLLNYELEEPMENALYEALKELIVNGNTDQFEIEGQCTKSGNLELVSIKEFRAYAICDTIRDLLPEHDISNRQILDAIEQAKRLKKLMCPSEGSDLAENLIILEGEGEINLDNL